MSECILNVLEELYVLVTSIYCFDGYIRVTDILPNPIYYWGGIPRPGDPSTSKDFFSYAYTCYLTYLDCFLHILGCSIPPRSGGP